jgi:hypothetical protein
MTIGTLGLMSASRGFNVHGRTTSRGVNPKEDTKSLRSRKHSRLPHANKEWLTIELSEAYCASVLVALDI